MPKHNNFASYAIESNWLFKSHDNRILFVLPWNLSFYGSSMELLARQPAGRMVVSTIQLQFRPDYSFLLGTARSNYCQREDE